MNLHQNHKVLPINDEEALRKENISIENSLNEFLENIDKLNILEKKIENEMLELDKLYINIDEEITKSFKLQREKLDLEENSLKDKLKNEVTKTKEKFEINLSRIKELSTSCGKIQKGIKLLEKENKNMIIVLSYVSKINKNKKEFKKVLNESMKNIKIEYDKEKLDIKFIDYYFNISPPIDIQFTNVYPFSFHLNWKYNENIDKNKIKFRIEIRKSNSNEEFEQIYEGNENKFVANNLNLETKYEIRICSFYDDIISNWSDIQKIKTTNLNMNVDSNILNESGQKDFFVKTLYNWCGYNKIELIYRGTKDGMNSTAFHYRCDGKGPTICLYKNDKGNIFGGFSSISWASKGGYVTDKNTFIFTLTNIYKTEPAKFNSKKADNKVYHSSERGPTFGTSQDIWIPPDFINNKCEANNFPKSYEDVLGKGNTIFTGNLNASDGYFKIKEIEVFKLT